ncbi:MAG: hypothetical protein KAS93_06840 [Gammaproteobacteria bacterium]|nr:hypothetical protein [Gammaproteobacteria bacterium]
MSKKIVNKRLRNLVQDLSNSEKADVLDEKMVRVELEAIISDPEISIDDLRLAYYILGLVELDFAQLIDHGKTGISTVTVCLTDGELQDKPCRIFDVSQQKNKGELVSLDWLEKLLELDGKYTPIRPGDYWLEDGGELCPVPVIAHDFKNKIYYTFCELFPKYLLTNKADALSNICLDLFEYAKWNEVLQPEFATEIVALLLANISIDLLPREMQEYALCVSSKRASAEAEVATPCATQQDDAIARADCFLNELTKLRRYKIALDWAGMFDFDEKQGIVERLLSQQTSYYSHIIPIYFLLLTEQVENSSVLESLCPENCAMANFFGLLLGLYVLCNNEKLVGDNNDCKQSLKKLWNNIFAPILSYLSYFQKANPNVDLTDSDVMAMFFRQMSHIKTVNKKLFVSLNVSGHGFFKRDSNVCKFINDCNKFVMSLNADRCNESFGIGFIRDVNVRLVANNCSEFIKEALGIQQTLVSSVDVGGIISSAI